MPVDLQKGQSFLFVHHVTATGGLMLVSILGGSKLTKSPAFWHSHEEEHRQGRIPTAWKLRRCLHLSIRVLLQPESALQLTNNVRMIDINTVGKLSPT